MNFLIEENRQLNIIKKVNSLESNLNFYFIKICNKSMKEILNENNIKVTIRNFFDIKKIIERKFYGCNNEKEYKSNGKKRILISVIIEKGEYKILKRGEIKNIISS